MKSLFAFLIIILSNISLVNAQIYGSLTDSRDGKIYKTVKIGERIWMAEDLAATKFTNGVPISNLESKEEWYSAFRDRIPAYCTAPNSKSKVYNGYVINNDNKLCPIGWRLPTDEDWDALVSQYGGYPNAGYKLKSKTSWRKYFEGGNSYINCKNCMSWTNEYKRKVACHVCKDSRTVLIQRPKIWKSGNGINTSGFNATPSGERLYDGQWHDQWMEIDFVCYWTLYSVRPGTFTHLIIRNYNNKLDWMDMGYSSFTGFESAVSVRCVKVDIGLDFREELRK